MASSYNNGCVFLTEATLFPFGAEVGDTEVKIDSEDGNSPYISPPTGFPFMGKTFDRVFVSF